MQSNPRNFTQIPHGPRSVDRRFGTRTRLLGAAVVLAIAGTIGTSYFPPINSAVAQAPVTASAAFPSFANVIERVRGAVVSVKVTVADAANDFRTPGFRGGPVPGVRTGDPLERFFRRFGRPGPSFGPPRGMRRSQGSGFVISADGYVVTNNHVVRNARKVQLTFEGGKVVDAKVVGRDPKTDIALLKITQPGTYKFVTFAKELPRVGDWVVAVGNPFGLGGTVTAGIVSARGRDIGSGPYDDFLQIDASVNRGNSGGPTFNHEGKVVGINTAIYSPTGSNVGIGFAIPATVASNVIDSLRKNGSVSRGYIGVQIQRITPAIAESLGLKPNSGALIARTTPGLPADNAGLRPGDVVVSVNGDKISGPRKLARKVAALVPGSDVRIGYIRKGESRSVTLKLADQARARKSASLDKPRSTHVSPVNPRFGMTLAPTGEVAGAGGKGVVVAQIDPSGLAASQGLRSGDIILEAGGKKLDAPADFQRAVSAARNKGRKAILLRVQSGSQTRFVALAFRNSNAG